MELDLTIKPVQSKSSKLKLNPLMEEGVIPSIGRGSSIVLVGRSGSGKSVLISNLLTRPEFYGDYFSKENRYLFSPTADVDSVAEEMGIEKKNRITKEMKSKLESLWNKREKEVKQKGGAQNTDPIAIVFDDLTGNNKLQNSKIFIRFFTAGRHLNFLCFVCVHKISALKRVCRLNCNYIMIFQSNNTELGILVDEQRPSCLSKDDFVKLVRYAWADPYSFLYIDNTKEEQTRYRKNLNQILRLS